MLIPDQKSEYKVDGEYAGQRVYVKLVVGYIDTIIPPAIKAAILLILGTLYDNESDNIAGRSGIGTLVHRRKTPRTVAGNPLRPCSTHG